MSNNLRILATADWHLQATKPPCRTDDFFTVQEQTLDVLAQEADEHPVDMVVVAGDVFPHMTVPDWLKRMVAYKFRNVLVEGVVGNHDVDFHRVDYLPRSSLGVLDSAGVIKCSGNLDDTGVIYKLHCDGVWTGVPNSADIVLAHQFVYKKTPPFPGAEESGYEVRRLPKGPRLIISGDNHQSFTFKSKSRLIVNPGCITRQRSDMADHVPKAYIINVPLDEDVRPEIIETITLPDTADVITREHIEEKEEKEQRFVTLTEKLNETETHGISFRANLEHKIEKTKMRKGTKQELSTKLAEHGGE